MGCTFPVQNPFGILHRMNFVFLMLADRAVMRESVQRGSRVCASSVLKNPQPARYVVASRLKMLMYWHIHFAFSPACASSRTRLRLFQQAARLPLPPEAAHHTTNFVPSFFDTGTFFSVT